jgi:beta-glucosidase
LLGDAEPSGRLPVTFPRSIEDTPAAEHYPGRNGVANYSEGRLMGYGWYDTVGREPLFPFGFGLGYSTFEVSNVVTGGDAAARTVTVTVTNIGSLPSSDVVQIYARTVSPEGDTSRPKDQPLQRLVGFARSATLAPGESATITVSIDPRAHQTWDTTEHDWVPTAGTHELHIGSHSRHLPHVFTV